jgi:hypothetical protein
MDYGALFSKSLEIIWEHKFMIVLGILVILGSAGSTGGTQTSITNLRPDRPQGRAPQFEFEAPFGDLSLGAMEVGIILLIGGLVLAVLVGIWVLSVMARGGLIYGAHAVDTGASASFSESFSAAWSKGWRLLGIALFPAIPMALLLLGGLVSYFTTTSVGGPALGLPRTMTFIPFLALGCVLLMAGLGLSLLRTFANRACMLEDLGVFASYRRGLEVLGENLGAALILFILQLALGLVIGLFLFVPGILIALCFLLWPILLLVQGGFAAYYSTLWTLAWARWTGRVGVMESKSL